MVKSLCDLTGSHNQGLLWPFQWFQWTEHEAPHLCTLQVRQGCRLLRAAGFPCTDPKIVTCISLSTNCPEVSRYQPQATQQTLAQLYSNLKFRLLQYAGHPHPNMNLSVYSLRCIAWVIPCLEPQGDRIWYPHETEMKLWASTPLPSSPQPQLQTPESKGRERCPR